MAKQSREQRRQREFEDWYDQESNQFGIDWRSARRTIGSEDNYKKSAYESWDKNQGATFDRNYDDDFAEEEKSAAEAEGREAERARYAQLLKEFSDQMMKPIDINDPEVANVARIATNASNNRSRAAGLGSRGLSQNAAEMGRNNALQGMQQSRYQMGMSAINQGAGLNMNREQLAGQARASDMEYRQNLANSQFEQRQAGAQGLGAVIGGLGGAALGSFGGPAGIAAGIGAGSSIGAGVGGMTAGARPVVRKRRSYGLGGY